MFLKISVRTLTENCLTLEDGRRLYKRIMHELSAGLKVELDFSGVREVTASFFNASLGFLLRDFDVNQLIPLVRVFHLKPEARDVLKRVVENSKRYYRR